MNEKRPPPNQRKKFIDAAREHGADENEKRWEKRLKKVAATKPDAQE